MAATVTSLDRVESPPEIAEGDSRTCGALLLGADYRALGVARSLGRHNIPVWIVNRGGHLVASTSRYVGRRVSWPEAEERTRTAFLLELSAKHALKGWMLFPTDDYTVALVARHHQALANHYRLTVPPWEEVQWACDKRLLHRLGARLGIPQPWTVCPSSREELKEIECPFPVILKLAVRTQPPSLAIPKAWRAEDRNALLASYDEAGRMVPAEDLIVQEIVPGGGEAQFSYAAICKQGRSLASLVARRTRQFPKDFGQFSTYVETVDEPSVIRPAEQLLAAMDYTGIVEIEFKRDPRNGEFKLFDINPRVWGWQSLSARAGVDFPFLLWLMVNGKGLPPACATAGKRWLHLTADLRVAVGEILRGHLSLWSYLRTFRGPRESAIFAWDDPLPGLLDLPLFAYSLGKRSLGTKNAQVGSL